MHFVQLADCEKRNRHVGSTPLLCVDSGRSMVRPPHPPVYVVSGSCWARARLWVSLSFFPTEEP